jgi:hypothetical protein
VEFDREAGQVTRGGFLSRVAGVGALLGAGGVGGLAESASAKAKPSASKRQWLFVQTARRGSWRRKPWEKNVYSLVLEGVSPQTVAFTDRPYRDVHVPPTDRFLRGLHFGSVKGLKGKLTGGPNAAIVTPSNGDKNEDVLVVSLYEPKYDNKNDRLSYEAVPIQRLRPTSTLHHLRRRQGKTDFSLPERFDDASLFIDSCGTSCWYCTGPGGQTIRQGMCWDWGKLTCEPCSGTNYHSVCKKHAGTSWQTHFTEPFQSNFKYFIQQCGSGS